MSHNTDRKPNRLIHETSPYLLQHAYNPVDWHPWGEEALQQAQQADKPILVSIGYAACHWCHVMERESFEDERIAALMNEYFVCIKVDREERPDVDHIYMDAVQAISGHGGWPLNMFLTPEGKPFYGGIYFPPVGVHGRPSWSQVLNSIHQTFTTNRAGVDDQADKLTEYLSKSDNNLLSGNIIKDLEVKQLFAEADVDTVFKELKKRFDKRNGGYGGAPKFPNTLSTQYLLRHYYHTGNKQALDHALLTLDKMIYGGIYDQLGGGFARYSVDDHWLAPHFEKMLYDNALLVSAMSEAYQITQLPIYKVTVEHTLQFIERELYQAEGGFYAALDADSEGHEGKFYVWTKAEVEQVLRKDANLFCQFYDITEAGNWEEVNILHVDEPLALFAQKHHLNENELAGQLAGCRQKLFDARAGRIRPGLDDKVILSWNALMCSGYIKAYEAFGNEHYLQVAKRNLDFLLDKFWVAESGETALKHTYKDGQAKYPAFLDDYACLIETLIDMYEASFDERYLKRAEELTNIAIRDFHDPESGQFFYTPAHQTDIIFRKKELFDSVTPSGNSTMAYNLNRLAAITGRNDFETMAAAMMAGIKTSMLNYSTSFTKWAMVMLRYTYPVKEIAVVGQGYQTAAQDIRRHFIPNKVLMGSDKIGDSEYPLLQNRLTGNDLLIYLCENYACQQPFNSVKVLLAEISK